MRSHDGSRSGKNERSRRRESRSPRESEPAFPPPSLSAEPQPVASTFRSAPGQPPPRRPFLICAASLLLVYLATLSGHQASIDGMLMQRQAHALVVDHSLRFQSPVWTWDGNAMWNSQYGIGQSLLFLPGYFVAAPLASLVPQSKTRPQKVAHYYYDEAYRDPLYAVGGSWVFAVLTSVAAYLVARLALALGAGPRAALWSMSLYGIGSTAFVYARGDFSQPLAGLCWTAGLLAAIRFRQSQRASWLWATAAIVGYGILSRPFEGLLLVPAVLVVMLPSRVAEWDRRALVTAVAVGSGVLAAVAITLLVNWGRFGELLHFGYTERARWMIPEPGTLAAVLVSPGRGILWQFPAVVLVPSGVLALVRRGENRMVLAVALLAGAMFVATTCWHVWWGGWCWGLRLFVPAIGPLAALAAVGIDELGSRTRRYLPALLLLAGFAWSLPCVLTDSLAGYAKNHDGAAGAWKLTALPPYGAWQYLRRLTAEYPMDIYGIDVLWFRIAHMTDGWTLAVPVVLVALALAAAVLGVRELLAAEPEADAPPTT